MKEIAILHQMGDFTVMLKLGAHCSKTLPQCIVRSLYVRCNCCNMRGFSFVPSTELPVKLHATVCFHLVVTPTSVTTKACIASLLWSGKVTSPCIQLPLLSYCTPAWMDISSRVRQHSLSSFWLPEFSTVEMQKPHEGFLDVWEPLPVFFVRTFLMAEVDLWKKQVVLSWTTSKL